jgi:PPP family 3-phenylpropionic acid transporter
VRRGDSRSASIGGALIEVFYFCHYLAVGVYMTFLPAYFRGLGLSGRQLSTVFTVTPLFALVIPLAWAYLADRTRRHDRVIQIVAGGAFLAFVPLLFARRFPAILGGWAGYALFTVALGGLADAFAVARVRAGAVYGRLRVWGSVGYVVAAVGVGGLLTARGGAVDGMAPLAMWLALGCAFAAALSLRGPGESTVHLRLRNVRTLLADRSLQLTLIVAALHWACLSPYHLYFGVYLRDLGLTPLSWALAHAAGVVAEVVVLMGYHRLQGWFSAATLLSAVFLVSMGRWLAIAAFREPWVLISLQVLHGMTFGMFWCASVGLVSASVAPPLRATGQALLVAAINLGAVVGNAVSGRLYDASGPRPMFVLAALAELAPLAVLLAFHRGLGGQADARPQT